MNENALIASDLECPIIDVTNSQEENDLVVQINETSQVAIVSDESICLSGKAKSDTTSHVTIEDNESISNCLSGNDNSDTTSHVTIEDNESISNSLIGKTTSDTEDLDRHVAASPEDLDLVNGDKMKDAIENEGLEDQNQKTDSYENAFKTVIVKIEAKERNVDRKVNNSLAIIREVVKQKVKQRAKKLKKNVSLKLFSKGKLVKIKSAKQKRVRSYKTKKAKRRKENWDSDTDTEMLENGRDIENNEIFKKVGGFFVCKYCSRKFQWVGPYTKHVARHRKHEFDCTECGKSFSNYRSLMAHKYNRQKDREFSCETCNFKTTTYCLLRLHSKEKHPSEIYFQCHICPKVLKTKSYLNSHLKHSHNINDGCYECNICGHVAKRPTHLQKHMKMHETETDKQTLDRDEFECIDCGKIFKSILHLRSHSRIHKDPKFLCDICAKGFCTKTKLREHRMIHTGEKPFKCVTCDYSSTQRGNLRLHMKTHEREEKMTTEKKPYKCQRCDYTANRVTYFLQHMKTHDKDKRDAERELEKQMEREVERIAKEEIAKRKEAAARESMDTQIVEHEQAAEHPELGRSVKETDDMITDEENYYNWPEPEYNSSLFYRAIADKSNIPKPTSSKKSKRKRKDVLPGKDMAASLDTQNDTSGNRADLATADTRTGFSNDVNNDPSLWTQEYFRTYMADQYRTGYQETAPHLMYLNQQRYYDAYSGIYESGASKQTQTAEEPYSDTKYSSETTLKVSGAEDKSYGNAAKQQDLNLNLFSSSTGQILRQLFGATQDIYSDSSVSNSYNTRQQYQDTVGAYDMSYSGMYMHHAEGVMSETANNDTQKYADYTSNMTVKSDISRPQSNYSTHDFDPYTAHAHDFSSALPEIPSDQLMQFNRKDEASLYQTAATDLSLSETAGSVFPGTEQEYSYEDLEQPQSVSGKIH